MSQPEKKEPETVEDQINAERLRIWREKRAALAETSRTERIRLAEADRRERLKAAEEEKAARARDAAEKRARDLAAERAERLAIARAKLAGRADIDAARERLQRYRTRAAWALTARLAGFVALPTLLVALYLFAVATPLYRAEATLALAPAGGRSQPALSPSSAPPPTRARRSSFGPSQPAPRRSATSTKPTGSPPISDRRTWTRSRRSATSPPFT